MIPDTDSNASRTVIPADGGHLSEQSDAGFSFSISN
jgi:hypothetical protein